MDESSGDRNQDNKRSETKIPDDKMSCNLLTTQFECLEPNALITPRNYQKNKHCKIKLLAFNKRAYMYEE